MARSLLADKWDIVAMNFRGCSGQPNRLLRSYHSGVTDDLHHVVTSVRERRPLDPIALIGFSLGGNVTLRYLGENGIDAKNHGIVAGAAISVPCELQECAERFARPENRFYMRRFLRFLFQKVRHRQMAFPEALDYPSILASENFHDFDGRFTAPVHGFDSAEDYWAKCSARYTANAIAVPTLLVNALNDPFLSPSCHLLAEAKDHAFLHVDIPSHGGHVGFVRFGAREFYQEHRVGAFLAATAPE